MRRNGKAQIRTGTIGNGMALRGWVLNRKGKAWKGVAMTREGNDELRGETERNRSAMQRKGKDGRGNGIE